MTDVCDGGCQCRQVRYTITGPLPAAYACHCGDCKKQSASAFSMSIPLEFGRLKITGLTRTCRSSRRNPMIWIDGAGR